MRVHGATIIGDFRCGKRFTRNSCRAKGRFLTHTDSYSAASRTEPKRANYHLPFVIGNLLGPLLLGNLFDAVGRKPMIAGTYILVLDEIRRLDTGRLVKHLGKITPKTLHAALDGLQRLSRRKTDARPFTR